MSESLFEVLRGARILVCEDEPFIALDLALSVRDADGIVVGPAASVQQAKQLLDGTIAAAILDVHLADGEITPIAEHLLQHDVPLVFHTGVGLPWLLEQKYPGLDVFEKPTAPAKLIAAIAARLGQ